MQDNEFDGLFRNKLNSFESEPSEKVWSGIDAELGDKKRSLLPWLSIAASIIVLASAGILFIPKGQKVNHGSESIVKTPVKPATIKPADQVAVNPVSIKKEEPVKQEQQINAARHQKPDITAPAPVKPDEMIARNEQAKPIDQPVVIAQVKSTTEPVKQPVVPGPETQLVASHNVDSAMKTSKPALIVKTQPEVKSETPAVKKHGIRSFGDLVNLVVAKVDKRKDKAVLFTDDEDGDGSTLTAVNIGPLKIGKDDKSDK